MPPASAKPRFEPPINWWKLDSTERAETLTVLAEWVPELVRRYGVTDQYVPPCWFRHEALVQELLALYQYRNQQQFLPVAPPSAPLDFHYQFQLALTRLRMWVGVSGCNGAEHLETPVQQWTVDTTVRASRWAVEIDEYVKEIYSSVEGNLQ